MRITRVSDALGGITNLAQQDNELRHQRRQQNQHQNERSEMQFDIGYCECDKI
jgi:hypothetical protein